MADTRANITLPADVWVDLYVASGITLGASINIWNKGSNPCDLVIKATAPTDNRGIPLWAGPVGSSIQVTQGETGVWARSDEGTYLVIQEM